MHAIAVGILCLLATSCLTVADAAQPLCEGGERTAVLMAQSVPTASLVPCVVEQPAGWFISDAEIKSGHTELRFGSNDEGGTESFLVVTLTPSCEPGDAVEVPSDEEGARQFETISNVTDGFSGDRFYVFDGGCATYRFNLRGPGWSGKIHDASAALSFTRRSTLESYVRESSNGLIEEL